MANTANRELVFFGNERLASGCDTKLPIVTALKNSGHKIKLIVINQSKHSSKNHKKLEIEIFAEKNDIKLHYFKNSASLIKELSAVNCNIAVLAAYGRIIPDEIINFFEEGILNLHPSLLPKYRGPTPIESSILNQDTKTGVSIMKLGVGMDDGPIFEQCEIRLTGDESKQDLADNLGGLGAKSIVKLLSSQRIPDPVEQSGAPVICRMIAKSNAWLDFSQPASTLESEVRAYLGWPGSKILLGLKDGSKLEVTIIKARAVSGEPTDSPLHIKAGEGFLDILELKVAGKSAVSGKDFLNGYRRRLE